MRLEWPAWNEPVYTLTTPRSSSYEVDVNRQLKNLGHFYHDRLLLPKDFELPLWTCLLMTAIFVEIFWPFGETRISLRRWIVTVQMVPIIARVFPWLFWREVWRLLNCMGLCPASAEILHIYVHQAGNYRWLSLLLGLYKYFFPKVTRLRTLRYPTRPENKTLSLFLTSTVKYWNSTESQNIGTFVLCKMTLMSGTRF